MYLPFEEQWVDSLAKIIHYRVIDNLYRSGIFINFQFTNVRAIGISGLRLERLWCTDAGPTGKQLLNLAKNNRAVLKVSSLTLGHPKELSN